MRRITTALSGLPPTFEPTINRLVTWDALIKEFVHNVFVTNEAEQLVVYEVQKNGGVLSQQSLVTLDVAYEGRPSAARSPDGRAWLFYHARQSDALRPRPASGSVARDQMHLWFKVFDQGQWLPARPLSFDGDLNKYPAVIQRHDGKWWLAWSFYRPGAQRISEIHVRPFDAGRDATPARLDGTVAGPYNFNDGDDFQIVIKNGPQILTRKVVVRPEHFANIAAATAEEIAALLDRELPFVKVSVGENGALSPRHFVSRTAMGAHSARVPLSPPAWGPSRPRRRGRLGKSNPGKRTKRVTPFALADANDRLLVHIDGGQTNVVTFQSVNFADIGGATPRKSSMLSISSYPGLPTWPVT